VKRRAQLANFYYYTGENVMEGDIIISENGHPAVVERIIIPGTSEAHSFECPDGGLLVRENWKGTPSYLVVTPPDGIHWEDMQFVRRRTNPNA
jgi:hypothetical protein